MALPELKITVFSDYICPFCYVGHHRLMRLQDNFDLRINWCFLEIHPEIRVAGEPITSLDYSADHWQQLLSNLKQLALEDTLPLSDITMITNSHDAMLLAEAAKALGRNTFYALHEKLFSAYFVEGRNIGDRSVLKTICRELGIEEGFADNAWQSEQHQQRLRTNFTLARQYEVNSVPAFVFGSKVLTGVVSEQRLREAAGEALLMQTLTP